MNIIPLDSYYQANREYDNRNVSKYEASSWYFFNRYKSKMVSRELKKCLSLIGNLNYFRVLEIGPGTGYLLKKLLARYVPMALFERPKMGFGVPIELWIRKDLKTPLLDYLSSERLKRDGLFNPAVVEQKIKEHLTGQKNHQYRLWSILMWEMWRERWLGN